MRRTFFLVLTLVCAAPAWGGKSRPPAPEVPVASSPVANLFVHPLLAFPEQAFRPGKNVSRMDEWFVTADEFRRLLISLDSRGYILVRASDVYRTGPSGVTLEVPDVPGGRKPLLLSVDDLNYYPYMRANGTVSRLQVGADGRLEAWSGRPGAPFRVDGDREIPQVLETFLETHPGFSHRGARGLIGLTGYEGILGWPTQSSPGPGLKAAQAGAAGVIRWLKDRGWEFASHSFAHRTKRSQNFEAWRVSESRWKSEVEPLTGPTPFYIFPYGENWWRDPSRWEALKAAGFQVFFGVETSSNLRWKDGLPIAGRIPVDGRGLRFRHTFLTPFLDPRTLWDPLRPLKVRY